MNFDFFWGRLMISRCALLRLAPCAIARDACEHTTVHAVSRGLAA